MIKADLASEFLSLYDDYADDTDWVIACLKCEEKGEVNHEKNDTEGGEGECGTDPEGRCKRAGGLLADPEQS